MATDQSATQPAVEHQRQHGQHVTFAEPEVPEDPSQQAHEAPTLDQTEQGQEAAETAEPVSDIPDKEAWSSPIGFTAAATRSNEKDTVYVQQIDRFRATHRRYLRELLARKAADEEAFEYDSALGTAITTHEFFRGIGVAIQGLTAGCAIFHAAQIWLSTPPNVAYLDFVYLYNDRALLFNPLYYAAFVIACTAALDRYDLSHRPLRSLRRAFTLQSGGISILLWLTALMASLACLPTEHRMDLFKVYNHTFLIADEENDVLQPWTIPDIELLRSCFLVRAVCALVAWLIVAARPNTDLLRKHMVDKDDTFRRRLEEAKAAASGVLNEETSQSAK